MKYRTYRLQLAGDDAEVLALLKKRLPQTYASLRETRDTARAIEVLFPGLRCRIASVERPQPAQVRPLKAL